VKRRHAFAPNVSPGAPDGRTNRQFNDSSPPHRRSAMHNTALGQSTRCDAAKSPDAATSFLHGIVNRTERSTSRTGKWRAGLKIQPDLQLASGEVHLALEHFQPNAQSQGLAEKNIRVHSRKRLPAKNRPCQPSLPTRQGSRILSSSEQVPPERLPRRSARSLGVHNPHQTGPCHPLKTSRSPNYDHRVALTVDFS
jgi:hypothetical protein